MPTAAAAAAAIRPGVFVTGHVFVCHAVTILTHKTVLPSARPPALLLPLLVNSSQYDVTTSAALLTGNRRLLEFSRSLKGPDPVSGSGNVVVGTANAKSRLGGRVATVL